MVEEDSEMTYENEYDDYQDYGYTCSDCGNVNLNRENSYTILKKDDIEKLRQRLIEDTMEFLGLEKEETALVLIHYHWNIDKLKDSWYENMEENRKKCGLDTIEKSQKEIESSLVNNKGKSNTCRICGINEINISSFALKCCHMFCFECWQDYLKFKMEDLLTCINSTCPQKGCNLVIPESVFLKFLHRDEKLKNDYNKALLKNFTDFNSDIKWCPSPDCGICVRVPGHMMKEIECECGTNFCFGCGKEGHRPCDCEMVERWLKKNKSESENVKWLIAHTKQCPQCHKYIEKNQGCNHMTCRKEAGGCGFEFCWICLGEWKPHGSSYYQCNKYDKDKEVNKEEMVKNAKLELEKYVFYFDRFMNHQKSQELGTKLKLQIKNHEERFRNLKQIPYEELTFMTNAVETIINSRRTLKNTYVFGFYMIKCNERELFEHNQFLLDRDTDRLHGMMEGETIKKILAIENYEEFTKSFIDFKNNVINLLTAINKYRGNLLDDIENKMLNLVDFNIS